MTAKIIKGNNPGNVWFIQIKISALFTFINTPESLVNTAKMTI
jgi:hypothetical protein